MLRRLSLLLLACALSLAFTATASANLLDVIAADYTDDGKLNPCKYTTKQLKTLKGLIPNDLAAYDAGFSPSIDDALARRAEGACNKAKPKADAAGATTAPAGAAAGRPRRRRPPAAPATAVRTRRRPVPRPTRRLPSSRRRRRARSRRRPPPSPPAATRS